MYRELYERVREVIWGEIQSQFFIILKNKTI